MSRLLVVSKQTLTLRQLMLHCYDFEASLQPSRKQTLWSDKACIFSACLTFVSPQNASIWDIPAPFASPVSTKYFHCGGEKWKRSRESPRDQHTTASLGKLRSDKQCSSKELRKDAEGSCSDHKTTPKGFGESQLPKAIILGAISKTPNELLETKSAFACLPPRMDSW